MVSKLEITDQLDALFGVIASSKSGLLIEEIEKGTGLELTRRTLQRRLDVLLEQGRIEKTGLGRATRYISIVSGAATGREREGEVSSYQANLFVPLSKQGKEVLRLVSMPLASRTAVAYNRDFLENYRPNISSFLSAKDKTRLFELGRTLGAEQAAGTFSLQILNRLLIDLSWNSSRLEGNTYSLLETQRLIELGQSVEGKAPRDAQMILNHKAAIEFLVRSADETGLDRRTILNLHALLADNLLDDPGAAGRLRREGVGIGGSIYMPPEIPQLIEECFDTILKAILYLTYPPEIAILNIAIKGNNYVHSIKSNFS